MRWADRLIAWLENKSQRLESFQERTNARLDATQERVHQKLDLAEVNGWNRLQASEERMTKRADRLIAEAGPRAEKRHKDRMRRLARSESRFEGRIRVREAEERARQERQQGGYRPYTGSQNYRGAGSRYMQSRPTVRFTDGPAQPKPAPMKPKEQAQSSWY